MTVDWLNLRIRALFVAEGLLWDTLARVERVRDRLDRRLTAEIYTWAARGGRV